MTRKHERMVINALAIIGAAAKQAGYPSRLGNQLGQVVAEWDTALQWTPFMDQYYEKAIDKWDRRFTTSRKIQNG